MVLLVNFYVSKKSIIIEKLETVEIKIIEHFRRGGPGKQAGRQTDLHTGQQAVLGHSTLP